MPIVPGALERLIIFRFNQGPGPLLDMWSAVAFRITLAAIHLDVFDTLHAAPLSAAELAQQIKTDVRGTATLLDTLEALGYVHKQGDRYANTAMTTKWLTRSSPTNFAAFCRYWGTLLSERWDDLENSIRVGQPALNLYEWIEHEPDTSRDFQTGMIAIARVTADEVIRKLRLPPTARRVLDVGGGHAMYSIALCRQHPELSATVLDSPQALNTGRESIATANMADRIAVQEGDFRSDDLGAEYDVAFLFNIIHGFTPDENISLFAKVAKALRPGGQIVILEQLAGPTPLPMIAAVSRILGMSYFHLLGGQIYGYDEVANWLRAVGFTHMRRINLLKALGSTLVLGTKVG